MLESNHSPTTTQFPDFTNPDQNFDLGFSTLENTEVLENFDFDSFLTKSADDAFNFDSAPARPHSSGFNTISEDLTEGAQTKQTKDLGLLLRKPWYRKQAQQHLPDQRTEGSEGFVTVFPEISETLSGQETPYIGSVVAGSAMTPANNANAVGLQMTQTQDGDNATLPGQPNTTSQPLHPAFPVRQKPPNERKRVINGSQQFVNPARRKPRVSRKQEATKSAMGYTGGIETIYMVHCESEYSKHHPAFVYLDEPTTSNSVDIHDNGDEDASEMFVHFNGKQAIFDLSAFMERVDGTEHNASLVVIRHVRCAKNQGQVTSSTNDLQWDESIAIKSSRLRTIIREIALCYYQQMDNAQHYISTDLSPKLAQYSVIPTRLFLFHHIGLLEAYMQRHPDDHRHLQPLISYCHHKYGADFREARALIDIGMITVKHWSKLFMPNTIAIERKKTTQSAFVVRDWPSLRSNGDLHVSGWYWSNKGAGLVRKSYSVIIACPEERTYMISELSVCPYSFTPPAIIQALEMRGRKFWSLKNGTHISYSGFDHSQEQFYPESRFIVDYQAYKKMHENSSATSFTPPPKLAHDRWQDWLDENFDPGPENYLVMPPTVHGFYLTEKQWIHLIVDNVSHVKWNKTAFDRLVLDESMKELVRALVTVRTAQKGIKHGIGVAGKRTDIIGGKGNGLIMLLHGGPGTGKTLTAESVAEIAEMPLYRVTCGDIGATPEAVEKYLGLVMYLGLAWNCVLLLDEADVFLEERTMSDLARNSLVSVFLRVLEYYDGILILTSNRVGIFDDAFRSRIQVALHYENLTKPSRKKIWNNFFEILEEDEEDANLSEIRLHLDKLAAVEMNGRQIRNTVTTARQLALYRKQRLDWEHFERALKVCTDFNNYLRRVHGHTEDQKARDDKLR